MLGKITKSAVDKLEPGSLLWDTRLVGFGVRRQLRHPHYVVRYRFSGKQKLVTIGRHGAWTPETARREPQRLLGVARGFHDPTRGKSKLGRGKQTLRVVQFKTLSCDVCVPQSKCCLLKSLSWLPLA